MFEGESLARTYSQEHLERHRSTSLSSRRSGQPSFAPAAKSISRGVPAETVHEHDDEHHHSDQSTTPTLADPETTDVEANRGEKQQGEKTAPLHAGNEDPFFVGLKGREHISPHTWSVPYRWALTGFGGLLVLNATFASSAPSNLIPSIIAHFNVSQEVGTLLISIFVAGYCLGPLLWGPLSERYGRRYIFIASWIPYFGFQIGCALSPNIGSLLVFRFLGGTFAASPLTTSGGLIADMWDADRRGDALAIFALMPFAGPALAPIISGYMEVTMTNWRWIFWVLTIFAGVCFIGILFILPETYVPVLLYREAKRLRKETGDDRWHSALDDNTAREGPKDVVRRTVLKPFTMIIQEPMLAVITLYMSLVYGVVYLLFEAVPIIFLQGHGLNAGETGLVFLALLGGGVIAVLLYVFYYNVDYSKVHHEMAPRSVPPEIRLKPLLIAAPAMCVSFFWVGWTSYPSISIASPILGILLLGFCVLFIFLACFNYIIDCYLINAASALSINTVLRSLAGAGFPLFASQMFRTLGTPGACSLLGGLALVFAPVPFLLMRYGKKIRSMSKNAVVREDE